MRWVLHFNPVIDSLGTKTKFGVRKKGKLTRSSELVSRPI